MKINDKISTTEKKELNKKHYVSGVDFRNELQLCFDGDRPTEKFCKMIDLMARKIQTQFRYECDEDREDIKQGAILVVLNKWRDYDMTRKTSAFSYFTSMIYNGLYATWNQYKKNDPYTVSLSVFEENV